MRPSEFIRLGRDGQARAVAEAICRAAAAARGRVYSITMYRIYPLVYGECNAPAVHSVLKYWLAAAAQVLGAVPWRGRKGRVFYVVDTKVLRDVCGNVEAFAEKLAAAEP